MFVRSDTYVADEALCAVQGYVGAYGINRLYGAAILNPLHGAICLAGVALTEKIFYKFADRFLSGSYRMFGPIPTSTKSLVSYGLATATTLKVMQVAGLITAVPKALMVLGLVCAARLAVGALSTGYQHLQKVREESRPLGEKLKAHANSTTFGAKIFQIPHDGKTYKVNILCNPNKSRVLHPGSHETSAYEKKYWLAFETAAPKEVVSQVYQHFPEEESLLHKHDFMLNSRPYFDWLTRLIEIKTRK